MSRQPWNRDAMYTDPGSPGCGSCLFSAFCLLLLTCFLLLCLLVSAGYTEIEILNVRTHLPGAAEIPGHNGLSGSPVIFIGLVLLLLLILSAFSPSMNPKLRSSSDRYELAMQRALLGMSQGRSPAVIVERLKEAYDLARDQFGECSEEALAALIHLGPFHSELGNPREALPYLEKTLSILRSKHGQRPETATALTNLGYAYRRLGRVDDAESCYEEALKIDQTFYPADHEEVLTDRNNLGMLLLSRNDPNSSDLTRARTHLEHIRQARQDNDTPSKPHVAEDYLNYACLLRAESNYAAAEIETRKGLHLLERYHPHLTLKIADARRNLATLLREQGHDAAEVMRLLELALTTLEAEMGPNHPDVAIDLYGLAISYAAAGEYSKALNRIMRAVEIDGRYFDEISAMTSEEERLQLLAHYRSSLGLCLSLVAQHLREDSSAVRFAFDLVQRRKGLSWEVLATQRESVFSDRYPDLKSRFDELSELRWAIAQRSGAAAIAKTDLRVFERRRQHLERELAGQVPEMKLQQVLRQADCEGICGTLEAGCVLVEYVHFDVFDFKAIVAAGEQRYRAPRYIAFFMVGGQYEVKMVDVGDAAEVDRAVAQFRAEVSSPPDERASRGNGTRRDLGAQYEEGIGDHIDYNKETCCLSQVGLTIYRAVFPAELSKALADQRRLLVAPDGQLCLLPFEALPTSAETWLIDEVEHLSYITVARDVLRFGAVTDTELGPPLVVADPDFDLCAVQTGGQDMEHLPPGRRTVRAGRKPLRFARLPGTRVEGERISAMLGVEPWLGECALERRLKGCKRPRILHLATHGFFLDDQEIVAKSGFAVSTSPGWFGKSTGFENPLLRSGVALAGANGNAGGFIPPDAAEDGQLTAEDVTGMDLFGTELVTLSACDTGCGDVHVGEGVFGLRRSFSLAGARTLVMSLWRVSDLATLILMNRFYENLLDRAMTRHESLHEAQKFTRNLTIGEMRLAWLTTGMIDRLSAGSERVKHWLEDLVRRPDGHRPFRDAYYWGAFICQGDPGSLTKA